MKIKIIFLILFFISSVLAAQQVYFAESHTEDGKPIGAKNAWDIKPWGSFIYIILENNDEQLKGNILYLFLDKKEDDKFQPFDSKTLNTDYGDTWAAYNYKFVLPGEYKAYFINSKQEKVAEEGVTIKFEDEYVTDDRSVGRSYYDNCRISFCEKILVGGEPLGVKRSISLSKNGSSIIVLIKNYAPLNTGKFLIDVWRKKNRAFDYDEFVESKKYRLNPDWPDAHFEYHFKIPGEYKFSIYNDSEVLIGSGYFTVYD